MARHTNLLVCFHPVGKRRSYTTKTRQSDQEKQTIFHISHLPSWQHRQTKPPAARIFVWLSELGMHDTLVFVPFSLGSA
jgi:hypothetical protein